MPSSTVSPELSLPPLRSTYELHRDSGSDSKNSRVHGRRQGASLTPHFPIAGSLQTITDKLKLLNEMMHTPEPGKAPTGEPPKFSPLDRLKLLREVAEDARVFRLGGEDKIRVATNTCETVRSSLLLSLCILEAHRPLPQLSTHTSHLSTLSTLLLGFLPAHLLPNLPAPSAPHGYPSSNTSLRGRYDYSAARHPGQGSTTRLSGALGMVREHYDMTRSGAGARGYGAAGGSGAAKKRVAPVDYTQWGDDYGASGSRSAAKDKDPSQRHPNQYTKKRMQAAAATGVGASPLMHHAGGAISATATNAAAGVYAVPQHYSTGETSREKRRADAAPAMTTSGNGSRAGSVAGGAAQQHQYYQSQDEYALAMQQQRGAAKRKVEDLAGGNKRRKKGCVSFCFPRYFLSGHILLVNAFIARLQSLFVVILTLVPSLQCRLSRPRRPHSSRFRRRRFHLPHLSRPPPPELQLDSRR
jgi:inhibitor of growth protein 3